MRAESRDGAERMRNDLQELDHKMSRAIREAHDKQSRQSETQGRAGSSEHLPGAVRTSRVDVSAARSAFHALCTDGNAAIDDQAEIRSLSYVRVISGGAIGGSAKGHVFKDSKQVSHFVRIGSQGAPEAYLFPHPRAAHNDFIGIVFPGLDRAKFEDRVLLAVTEPLRVTRRGSSGDEWEVS